MRIYDCQQGSEKWHKIRCGRPTASNFSKILTAARLELSKSRIKYAIQLAADIKGVATVPPPPTAAMEWGIDNEPLAVADYENRNGVVCEKVGFVYPDDSDMWGCSPDRFVWDSRGERVGLLECKCPNVETLIEYSLSDEVPSEYRLQVQGQLWITGLDWCDFFVFHPDLRDVVQIRVEPDEQVFEAFETHIPAFCKEVIALSERINATIDWSSLNA